MYNTSLRKAITRVRLSSHLFFIERARWGTRKILIEDRICDQCLCVEDEFHCLIECPKFLKERKGLLPHNLRVRPSMFEFINFFNTEEKGIQYKLGLLCFNVQKEYKKGLMA